MNFTFFFNCVHFICNLVWLIFCLLNLFCKLLVLIFGITVWSILPSWGTFCRKTSGFLFVHLHWKGFPNSKTFTSYQWRTHPTYLRTLEIPSGKLKTFNFQKTSGGSSYFRDKVCCPPHRDTCKSQSSILFLCFSFKICNTIHDSMQENFA